MTEIRFNTVEEMNEYLTNGINIDTDTVDNLFDELTSEADYKDRVRSINAFSRVSLDY